MKNLSLKKFVLSIALMLLISTLFSYAMTGSATQIAVETCAVLIGIGFIRGMIGHTRPGGLVYVDGFVITDTTYAGEAASQFLVKAITGADTINGGHAYIKDNIKKKFTIPKFDSNYEDFIQDRQPTPTSKGSFTTTGAVLNPADIMIYTEFNPRDWEDHWMATQLNPTLIDRSLPYTVESVVIQQVMQRWAKYFNKAIWNNDTALSTIYKYFNGWLKNAANDATVIDVSTPITLSAANIQAELLRCYNAIPVELRYDMDMKFFVSYATWDMYDASQVAQTYKGIDITQMGSDKFKGHPVVKIADFPDNVIFVAKGKATPESNLWIGLNSVSDEGLQLQKLQANSELYFIKMLVKADVQIGWGAECVAYGL